MGFFDIFKNEQTRGEEIRVEVANELLNSSEKLDDFEITMIKSSTVDDKDF